MFVHRSSRISLPKSVSDYHTVLWKGRLLISQGALGSHYHIGILPLFISSFQYEFKKDIYRVVQFSFQRRDTSACEYACWELGYGELGVAGTRDKSDGCRAEHVSPGLPHKNKRSWNKSSIGLNEGMSQGNACEFLNTYSREFGSQFQTRINSNWLQNI